MTAVECQHRLDSFDTGWSVITLLPGAQCYQALEERFDLAHALLALGCSMGCALD
jgi:hypothetical protein